MHQLVRLFIFLLLTITVYSQSCSTYYNAANWGNLFGASRNDGTSQSLFFTGTAGVPCASGVENMGFSHFKRTTLDGSLVVRIGAGASSSLYGGVQIRQGNGANDRFYGVYLPQNLAASQTSASFFRSSTGATCTGTFGNFGFVSSETTFGYIKLERVGTSVIGYWSYDQITWFPYSAFTLSSSWDAFWGLTVGGASATDLPFPEIHVTGLGMSGCPAGQRCSYRGASGDGVCSSDPVNSFIECGANQWRTMMIAPISEAFGSSVQFSIAANSLTMEPKRANVDNIDGGTNPAYTQEDFSFMFKQVSGNGILTAKFAYPSTGSMAYTGLLFEVGAPPGTQVSRAPDMFSCLISQAANVLSFMKVNTAIGVGNLVSSPPSISGNSYWLRLRKNGNTFTCQGSNNGASWTSISSATSTYFNSVPYYAGVVAVSRSVPATVDNIMYDGFLGYCNNRGKCGVQSVNGDLDKCQCYDYGIGEFCQWYACYGKNYTDPTACNSRGTCTGENTCTCSPNYSGSQCETENCYGIPPTNPAVCSGKGTCVGLNDCDCNLGWTQANCSAAICFGKLSTDVSVCSGKGSCTAPDTCACNTGWTTSNCSVPICSGKLATDPTVCSGRATCSAPNTCNCPAGWGSLDCSLPICYGQLQGPTACSGPTRGTCTDPNTCTCLTGYGFTNCSIPICYGKLATDSTVCTNRRGRCDAPNTCVCPPGWTGSECSVPLCYGIAATSGTVCSNRGTCVVPDVCANCGSGWGGSRCELPRCYGILSNSTSVCTGRGTCVLPDVCSSCNQGWGGSRCHQPLCFGRLSNATNVCSSRGTCASPDSCVCTGGWGGANCQIPRCFGILANSTSVCSGRGTCVLPDTCSSCALGYGGSSCQFPICFGHLANDSMVCTNGQGICTAPNICTCVSDGYNGTQCEITQCNGRNFCTGNGICVGANNCSCNVGWTGLECQTFICPNVNNCTPPRGTCTGPNTCTCISSWTGPSCQIPTCFGKSSLSNPVACSGVGTCVSPNSCNCLPNNVGNECQVPVCFGVFGNNTATCSRNGTCVAANTCNCATGYTGNNCQIAICYGVAGNETETCSGHGSCVARDVCSCDADWTGNNCQTPICYGKVATHPTVCSGAVRGSCVGANQCSCTAGYTGAQCEIAICFGILGNSSSVCSGEGNCTAKDTCQCDVGYYGPDCSGSHLWDFFNSLCLAGTCTLNRATWQSCIFTGGKACYCNPASAMQNGIPRVSCNALGEITAIRLGGANLLGEFTQIRNLTKLTTLDLSTNQVKVTTTLSSLLPSSIVTLNLATNGLNNQGFLYELDNAQFPSLVTYNMNQNSICGVWPETWLPPIGYTLTVTGHQRTLFCPTTRNSIACSVLQVPSTYALFPSETMISFNYTNNIPTACQSYLKQTQLQCEVTTTTNTNYRAFATVPFPDQGTVYCPRTQLIPGQFNQLVNLAWAYPGGTVDLLSTKVTLSVLPFITITDLDRPLMFTRNDGGVQMMLVTVNQNTTAYRKDIYSPIKCLISPDNYFVNAIPIGTNGLTFNCPITMGPASTTKKTITLWDSSERWSLTQTGHDFYLFDWFANPNTILISSGSNTVVNIWQNYNKALRIPAITGDGYELWNAALGTLPIAATGTLNTFTITAAQASLTGGDDIRLYNMTLRTTGPSSRDLTIITMLFHRRSQIFTWPKAIRAIGPQSIIAHASSSFLRHSIFGGIIQVEQINPTVYNIIPTVINGTNLQFTESVNLQKTNDYRVMFTYGVHRIEIGSSNVDTSRVYFVAPLGIYPTVSPVITSDDLYLEFQYDGGSSAPFNYIAYPYTFCRVTNGSTALQYKITPRSTNPERYWCNFTSPLVTGLQNMTLWYDDPVHGAPFQVSSNYIPLTFLYRSAIVFASGTVRIGASPQSYSPTLIYAPANMPVAYSGNVRCMLGTQPLSTTFAAPNQYTCIGVTMASAGIAQLSLAIIEQPPIMVPSNPATGYVNRGAFFYTRKFDVVPSSQINPGAHSLRYSNWDTRPLIASGRMRSDCLDILVVFGTTPQNYVAIKRAILSGCNTANTIVAFDVRATVIGGVTDTRYAILYGNDYAFPNSYSPQDAPATATFPNQIDIVAAPARFSSNVLDFPFITQSLILSTDPSSIKNYIASPITLQTAWSSFAYGGLVRFEIRNGTTIYTAGNSGSNFTATIASTFPQILSLSVWAGLLTAPDTIPLTTNSIPLIVQNTVSITSLSPFVGKYTGTTASINVQVNLDIPLSTFVGLKCKVQRVGSASTIVNPVSWTPNGRQVTCPISLTGLNLNAERVDVGLFMDVSTTPSRDFDITAQPMTFVFFKEAVNVLYPSFLTQSNFNTGYFVDFNDPLKDLTRLNSYQSYTFILKPQTVPNPNVTMNCVYTGTRPVCSMPSTSFTHTPMVLVGEMQVFSASSPTPFIVAMNSVLFRENVTFVNEMPFVIDSTLNAVRTITFQVSKSLQPNHNYACFALGVNVTAVKNAGIPNQFTCVLKATGVETIALVDLYLVHGTFGGMISTVPSNIQVVSLKFSPPTTEKSATTGFTIQKGTGNLIIPINYRALQYHISSTSPVARFTCVVNGGTGVITCTKTAFGVTSFDIWAQDWVLETPSGINLINIKRPLIMHTANDITGVAPLSSLRGTNQAMTLTFAAPTLRISMSTIPYTLYCRHHTGFLWVATRTTDTSMGCTILYSDATATTLYFTATTQVPSISGSTNLAISVNTSNPQHWYLDKGAISYSDVAQKTLMFTGVNNLIAVRLNTFVPPHLTTFLQPRLNGGAQQPVATVYTGVVGQNHGMNATFNTAIPGLQDLRVYMNDPTTRFELSTSPLQVVMIPIVNIVGYSPQAVIANFTTFFTFQTTLPDVDYGVTNFTCKYGYNTTRSANIVAATRFGSSFKCTVYDPTEGSILFLSIWAKSGNDELKLTTSDVVLSVVDGNFFAPSYGTPTGGELVVIEEYLGANSNITFNNTINAQFVFRCSATTRLLSCITPVIPNNRAQLPLYSAHLLKFMNQPGFLSAYYVFYERRVIMNVVPQVIPLTASNIQFNTTLDKIVTLNQGTFQLVFAAKTNWDRRYNAGQLANSNRANAIIQPLGIQGTSSLEIYYQNELSFEFQSMFSISPENNVTFVSTGVISKVGGTDIQYVGVSQQIQVNLNTDVGLSEVQHQRVRCRIGSSFVSTTYLGGRSWVCTLNSPTEKVDLLTLWYFDSLAWQGQFQISSNALDVIFVRTISITAIQPFASLDKVSEDVILNSTLITSVYGTKVTYWCAFNGTQSVAPAVLTGGRFACTLLRNPVGAYGDQVFLWIRSVQSNEQIQFANSSALEFYFLDQVEINSIFPVVAQTTLAAQVTVRVNADVLTTTSLFCRLNSTDGIRYVPATYSGNRRTLRCAVTKLIFPTSYEQVLIGLYIDLYPALGFQLTSNNDAFAFVRSPLDWETPRMVSDSVSIRLNFTIPTGYPHGFALNMTLGSILVPCTFMPDTMPTCLLNQADLNLIGVYPATLQFLMYVTHATTDEVTTVGVQHMMYYPPMVIQHLKPAIVGFSQNLNSNIRSVLNVYHVLNSSMLYRVFLNQYGPTSSAPAAFNIRASEVPSGLNPATHIGFAYKTFGSPVTNFATLQVQDPFTSAWTTLTSLAANITVTDQIVYPDTGIVRFGPSTGGTLVPIALPFGYPTTEWSNYNYTLKLWDRSSYVDFTDCNFVNSRLTCRTPNIQSRYADWSQGPRKLRIDFLIDGMRAYQLQPFFTFYPSFSVKKILPSRFLFAGQPYLLSFETTPFSYSGQMTLFVETIGTSERSYLSCQMRSTTLFACSTPLTIFAPANAQVSISFNQIDYIPMNVTLTCYSGITIGGVSTNTLSMYRSVPLYITTIETFINTGDINIKMTDNQFNLVLPGTYINTSHVLVNVPPFYDKDAVFPRSLATFITFDNGGYYFNTGNFMNIPAFPNVELTNLLPRSTTLNGMFLTGFPSTGIEFAGNQVLVFRLVDTNSSANVIRLNCHTSFSRCDLVGTYNGASSRFQLKVGLNTTGKGYADIFVPTNIVEFYNWGITPSGVFPRKVVRNSPNPVWLYGDFSRFKDAKIVLQWNVPVGPLAVTTSIGSVSGATGVTAPVPPTIQSTFANVLLSVNGGAFFHPTGQSVTMIDGFTITQLLNPDNLRNPDVVFTFLRSNVTLFGTGFANTGPGNVMLTLSNAAINVNITNISPIRFISTTQLQFDAPKFSQLGITFPILYPLTLNLGLSLNGGADFQYIPMVYNDQYPQPIYTQIYPSIIIRRDMNITITGLNLDIASICSFYLKTNVTDGAEIYESIPIPTSQSNAITCFLPAQPLPITVVGVYLKNQQGIRGPTNYDLNIYDPPTVQSIFPSTGPTFGGFSVEVTGTEFKFNPAYPRIYCKFGSISCIDPCTWINANTISCVTPAYVATTSAVFYMSYNRLDWHPSAQFSEFTACPTGYGSPNFNVPCKICSPGTYKPTIGIYSCLKCENNTYTEFSGSLSCDRCPTNTTTDGQVGASSLSQCLCSSGFYMNTRTDEVYTGIGKCIECPRGGACNNTGTVIPLAKPGYWYDKTDWTNFGQCLPAISCPGGGFENCTQGYTGLMCGICSRGFYRFKKTCEPCGDVGSAWLRLLGIALAIIIVTIIFFALSSTKVSHIASIAIAFSFWQVLSMFARFDIQWPAIIGGGLTGASIANFNVDFLSPACIFPDMNYVTYWYLQMMMPVAFLVSFLVLYAILIIRSVIATVLGQKIKIPYIRPDDDEDEVEEYDEEGNVIKRSVWKKIGGSIWRTGKSTLVWTRNFIIWCFTEKSSIRELRKIMNRCINSYFAFLSFSFIFIMTTASLVFVCREQTSGAWTLNESPDIKCFTDTQWWIMAPLSILWYIIFGVGSLIYFVVIWFKYRAWSKDTDFVERNKFMLSRFRDKYYFWEAVVTLRKTILSILYIFFKPMLVIVSGVLLLFIGFLIHIHFVPFKRKFHNIMDYFVLLVTMATLFFGLLFFVNKWPDTDDSGYSALKVFSEYTAFIVLVISTIIVVIMILWDSFTRRRKDKARLRAKLRRLIADEEEDRRLKRTVLELYDMDEEVSQVFAVDYPWDTAFNYKPITFKTDSESTSSDDMSMNAIFEDIFSSRRLKKNIKKFQRVAVKTTNRIINKLKKHDDEELVDTTTIGNDNNDAQKINKMDKKTAKEYIAVKKKIARERRAQEQRKAEKAMTSCYVRNITEEKRLQDIEDKLRAEEEGKPIEPRRERTFTEIPMKDAPKSVALIPVVEQVKVEEKVEVKVEEVKKPVVSKIRRDALKTKKVYPFLDNPKEFYPVEIDSLTYTEETDDVVVWEDENQKAIKESTLGKLIELLTSPTYFDSAMQHTFMLTFRSFVDKETLYKMLIERFNIPPPQGLTKQEFSEWKVEKLDKTRLRVVSSIKYWLENFYHYDFMGDEKMLQMVQESIDMMETISGGQSFTNIINRALSKAIDAEEKLVTSTPNYPEIQRPQKKGFFGGSKIKNPILLWPSIEIARQLTLIEFGNFKQIEPKECLNQSWAKGQRETKAPGICAMVSRFNTVSMWVGTVICQTPNMDERVEVIEKFIDITDCLWNMNNFNGVFTICSGLSLASIFRLKKSWPQVNEEVKTKFDNLNKAISRDGNFAAIRSRIKNVKPPAMPYIGIYLTDLTFIEDGNPNKVKDKINFVKCKYFAAVIRDMQMYQDTKYEFAKATELYEPLMNLTTMTDGEMYKASLEIEPKAVKK